MKEQERNRPTAAVARDPEPPVDPDREPEPVRAPGRIGIRRAPETDERPVPGIEHPPEPDGENIMPAEDRPGTL